MIAMIKVVLTFKNHPLQKDFILELEAGNCSILEVANLQAAYREYKIEPKIN